MKLTTNLRTSTATAALVIALSAPAAFAQATADTNMGVGETILLSADYPAGNTQKADDGGDITSTTTNNFVNLSITVDDAIDDIVTAAAPETNNLISASATGNVSTAAAELLFAPGTSGDTAAVGTLQAVEVNVTASSTNDTHSIVIENTGTGIRTFTGAALSDNNDITAAATGNNATSSITAAAGLDLDEAAGAQASLDIDSSLAAATDNDVLGDLIVSSSQEIDPVDAGVALTVSSTVSGAATTTLVEGLDGATVTLSNSDQASATTGNSATSSITSLDTTASITASTAVSNLQTIEVGQGATISATTTASTISVTAGQDSINNTVGDITGSTISVADNSQTAAATGSASTQSITLDASSITGEGLAAVINDADAAANGTVLLSADADSIIGNVQTIEAGVSVAGAVTDNVITITVTELDNDNLDTSTLEVTGNDQAASATGVSTSNTLSLTSGATMSAAGAVASAQEVDGEVTSTATGNAISITTADEEADDSSIVMTSNTVSATATGARATNTLATSSGTNNLSVAANVGIVENGLAAGADQPSVTAGQALTNDQAMGASGVVSSEALDNQILTSIGDDANDSNVTTDLNVMSASATANQADNTVSLAFNELQGGISGVGTGVVAATANEQTLADGATITARNVGLNGEPIRTEFGSDSFDSSVSTSQNTVSVAANGNVTTGNDVVVDATNITSGSEAAPSTTTAGVLTATGSFVSASTQTSGADILASQLDVGDTTSNTIITEFGDDIEPNSTVVSDDNVLSAVATANSANNAVQLGDAQTATVSASGVTANYQSTSAAGSVSAELGIEGTDATAPYSSTNGGSSDVGSLAVVGNDIQNTGATPVTLTFNTPLTQQEVDILTAAGYTGAALGGTSATLAAGDTADFSVFDAQFGAGGGGVSTGDESFTITGFVTTGTAPTLSGAGVLVQVDGGSGGTIESSTVSVSGNTAVGEVSGNSATNATSATATSIVGLSALATTVDIGDAATADPTNSDLATTNVQVSEAPLSSDVYAVFGIVAADGDGGEVDSSTQIVSDNLQQSYATANRATNSVDVTATNSDADTALDSIQLSNGSVATVSGMQVLAEAASINSSLELDGNTNQSVANGNVVGNAVTVDVTNATDGTALGDDAGIDLPTFVATANNVLSSTQSTTSSVTASAETDVFNQDIVSTDNAPISNGDVSLSGNSTIAQATANSASSGNTMTLGNAGTANMDQTGFLSNLQVTDGAATVSSNVDQEVSVTLSNTGNIPVNTSSLSLDGNGTTALARSNVATNTLIVDGGNIDAGVGTDASLDEGTSLAAAYVLGSTQDNAATVTAATTQSRVEVAMSDTGGIAGAGGGVLNSTISLSDNASSATALANTAVNAVTVGANAANVDATTALANAQDNSGAVSATGGSAVVVDVTLTGGTDPVGINGSSVMVSDNTSASNAVGNQSQNTLTASGANIVSGDATSALVDSQVFNDVQANAGNLLVNNQDNSGAITSTNTANVVGISSEMVEGTTTIGSAASGSTLGVMGNVTEARASANLSLNSSISIGGAGTASLDSTAVVANFQFNDDTGGVTSSASTTTTVGLTAGDDATALDAGTAMVQGNSTLALARGNVAENVVMADGANVSSGASPATLNSNAFPDTGSMDASFGVFNEQLQQAPINAESIGASYRVNVTSGPRTTGTLGLALNASSATVSDNAINASAFGNVATNRVSLASLSGGVNDASAAVYNGQMNQGTVASTVSGATIGAYSIGGVSSASIGVSDNSISATSVGNFATSTVTRTDR